MKKIFFVILVSPPILVCAQNNSRKQKTTIISFNIFQQKFDGQSLSQNRSKTNIPYTAVSSTKLKYIYNSRKRQIMIN